MTTMEREATNIVKELNSNADALANIATRIACNSGMDYGDIRFEMGDVISMHKELIEHISKLHMLSIKLCRICEDNDLIEEES